MQSKADNPWIALARTTVDAVWTSAQTRLEALDVTRVELLEVSVTRTLRRFSAAGQTPNAESFRQALERTALEDLGLAIAWERGNARAWELYHSDFRTAVIAASIRQGFTSTAAEDLADELPGALLAARAEGMASPLARYDGSGSLRGWLCTIARRRVADRIRGFERSEELKDAGLASEQASPSSDAEHSELNERLRATCSALRDSLSPGERLAFLLKHDQQLPQRKIAVQMGISDSRVTRILQHATAKVREHLLRELGEQVAEEQLPTNELLRALGKQDTPQQGDQGQ